MKKRDKQLLEDIATGKVALVRLTPEGFGLAAVWLQRQAQNAEPPGLAADLETIAQALHDALALSAEANE